MEETKHSRRIFGAFRATEGKIPPRAFQSVSLETPSGLSMD